MLDKGYKMDKVTGDIITRGSERGSGTSVQPVESERLPSPDNLPRSRQQYAIFHHAHDLMESKFNSASVDSCMLALGYRKRGKLRKHARLWVNLEMNLVPVAFLEAIGISEADLLEAVDRDKADFRRELERVINPSYWHERRNEKKYTHYEFKPCTTEAEALYAFLFLMRHIIAVAQGAQPFARQVPDLAL